MNNETKKIEAIKFRPTRDPWLPECVNGGWHKGRGKAEAQLEVLPSYSVIAYFRKLNNGGKLPQAVKKAVSTRGIKWARIQPGENHDDNDDGDYSPSASDSEESD